MADHAPEEIIRQAGVMHGQRSQFDIRWQDVRNYLQPLVQSFTTKDLAGVDRRTEILDNSGETFSQLLVSGLHGMLTNPNTEWHRVRAKRRQLNELPEVRRYLEHGNEVMRYVLDTPETGFTTQLTQAYHELVDFGTNCMYIADRPGRLPLFQTRNLAQLLLRENADGQIDTVFREFELTARQAVQEFGGDNLSETTRKLAATHPDRPMKFIHAVYPRTDSWPGANHGSKLPFASQYVSVDDKTIVRTGGFHEMPFIIGRWWVLAGEVYGRGPGLKALADVKMLQRAMRITIRGVEKMVDPPLMVANDGVLGPVRLSNNSVNVVRPDVMMARRPAIEKIETGGRPDLGEEFMAGVRQRIGAAYFSHLLQMSRDPRMTATQALLIDEETLRHLGPFMARVQAEFLGKGVQRTWNILERAGEFGEKPTVLEGEPLEVQYVSPAVKAQRLGEVSATARLVEMMKPITDINPGALDIIDTDQTFRHSADRLGVPFSNLRSPEEVAQIRQARQAAEREEAERQNAVDAAKALQSLSQAEASAGGAANAPVGR
jgi:hypothetical protein